MLTNLWSFNYKRNPEPVASAIVEAKDEPEAMAVAMAWCEQMGERYRFIGNVRKMVVADASILKPVPVEVEGPVMERAKASAR